MQHAEETVDQQTWHGILHFLQIRLHKNTERIRALFTNIWSRLFKILVQAPVS